MQAAEGLPGLECCTFNFNADVRTPGVPHTAQCAVRCGLHPICEVENQISECDVSAARMERLRKRCPALKELSAVVSGLRYVRSDEITLPIVAVRFEDAGWA